MPETSTSLALAGEPFKADRYGSFVVPENATLVSFEHEDPFVWRAVLTLPGDAVQLGGAIAEQLRTLWFVMPATEDPNRRPCALERCELVAYLPGSEGAVEVTIVRRGVISEASLVRSFEHRVPQDPYGPPDPPPQGPDTGGPPTS